jgi:hypothetical protein
MWQSIFGKRKVKGRIGELQMNPFFSEFRSWPKLRSLLESKWACLWLALILSAWTALSLTLARLVGAACIEMIFGLGSGSHIPVTFGFWAELNHGVFHLLGIPFLAGTGLWFLNQAGQVFDNLAYGSNPMIRASTGSVKEIVSLRNHCVFIWLLPCVTVISFVVVLRSEIHTYDSRHLGWVQASFYSSWEQSKGKPIDKLSFYLPRKVQNSLTNSASDVTLTDIHRLEPMLTAHDWHYVFLIVALAHQILAYSLGLWIAGKILFVIALLSTAMRFAANEAEGKISSAPLRARLDFGDDLCRFGFSPLDRLYDGAALITAGTAFGVLLQIVNNAKDYNGYVATEALLPRLLSAGVPALIIVAILGIPVTIFGILTSSARSQEYRRLTDQIDRALESKQKEELIAQRNMVGKQRAWPADDKFFISLVTVSVGILVCVPLGLSGIGPDKLNDAMQQAAEKLPCVLCGWNH